MEVLAKSELDPEKKLGYGFNAKKFSNNTIY